MNNGENANEAYRAGRNVGDQKDTREFFVENWCRLP